jgi:hypothetical protein
MDSTPLSFFSSGSAAPGWFIFRRNDSFADGGFNDFAAVWAVGHRFHARSPVRHAYASGAIERYEGLEIGANSGVTPHLYFKLEHVSGQVIAPPAAHCKVLPRQHPECRGVQHQNRAVLHQCSASAALKCLTCFPSKLIQWRSGIRVRTYPLPFAPLEVQSQLEAA